MKIMRKVPCPHARLGLGKPGGGKKIQRIKRELREKKNHVKEEGGVSATPMEGWTPTLKKEGTQGPNV